MEDTKLLNKEIQAASIRPIAWFLVKAWPYILALVFIVYPIFSRNHIYQTLISVDAPTHTKWIQAFTDNVPSGLQLLYPAQYVFGYILGNLNKALQIPNMVLFTWFMVVCLGISIFTIYKFMDSIAGKTTAVFAVLINLFCVNSLLAFFEYGVMGNLIDMYIVLPFVLLFMTKWLSTHKARYLIGGLILTGIFSSLHLVAIYVPYTAIAVLAGLAVHKVITKKPLSYYKTWFFTDLAVFVVGMVCIRLFLWRQLGDMQTGILYHIQQLVANPSGWGGYISQFVSVYFGVATLAIGMVVALAVYKYRSYLKFNTETKYLLFILVCMVAVLGGGSLLRVIDIAGRLLLDFSSTAGFILAIVLGSLWQQEIKWLKLSSGLVICIGFIMTLVEWIR